MGKANAERGLAYGVDHFQARWLWTGNIFAISDASLKSGVYLQLPQCEKEQSVGTFGPPGSPKKQYQAKTFINGCSRYWRAPDNVQHVWHHTWLRKQWYVHDRFKGLFVRTFLHFLRVLFFEIPVLAAVLLSMCISLRFAWHSESHSGVPPKGIWVPAFQCLTTLSLWKCQTPLQMTGRQLAYTCARKETTRQAQPLHGVCSGRHLVATTTANCPEARIAKFFFCFW